MKRLASLALVILAGTALAADQDPFRVLKEPPKDSRVDKPKDLNGYFPLAVPATKEAWEKRRQELREQVLVANGLWPMPEKTPLNPVIHGKIDRDDYTIEKVFFASHPGPLRQRQPLSAEGQDRQAARRALPARPLGQRPVLRGRREGRRRRDRAAAPRRPWKAPATRCRPAAPAGPAWAASSSTTTWSATPTASRSRIAPASPTPRPSCGCRASWACKPGTASAPSTSSSSLPDVDPKRIGVTGAQRRRHADVHPLRHRRPARRRLPRRHGLDRACRAAASARTAPTCASAPATSSWPACSPRSRWP